MDTGALFSLAAAFYVAWSIGANDEAVAPLAGSGAMSLNLAVAVGGVSALLGAVFMGERVEKTLGRGLLLGSITETEALLILVAIATWLTAASILGWPVSTTRSSVGAIIGLGVAKWGLQGVRWGTIGTVAISWIASPFIGFIGAALLYRVIRRLLRDRVKGLVDQMKLARRSALFLTFWVLITSFSRGANDIANATAILGSVDGLNPIFIRGFVATGMMLGLIIIGRKVIQSVGVDLVKLDPVSALASQIAVALTMFVGTYLGMPLSGTHILVGAVVGLGVSKGVWVNVKGVKEITYMWVATFIGAAAITAAGYTLLTAL
ncbi:inorganic phosphate transporter [Candidatus Bathyarchaeota archaeon]|nr:inorganic phosphate transporter [Candidatus Bathyarchaeota archaeon]